MTLLEYDYQRGEFLLVPKPTIYNKRYWSSFTSRKGGFLLTAIKVLIKYSPRLSSLEYYSHLTPNLMIILAEMKRRWHTLLNDKKLYALNYIYKVEKFVSECLVTRREPIVAGSGALLAVFSSISLERRNGK